MGSRTSPIEARQEMTRVSLNNAQGREFHARRPRDKPLNNKSHKPGVISSPYDRVETFHAQSIPPGSSPPDKTFLPRNIEALPGAIEDTLSGPLDGMPGAASTDVDRGLGQPMLVQTDKELHHGVPKRKQEPLGAVGKYGTHGKMKADLESADPRTDPHQRASDKDEFPHGVAPEKIEHTVTDAPKEQAK